MREGAFCGARKRGGMKGETAKASLDYPRLLDEG